MFSHRKRFRYGNALRRSCAALVGFQLAFGSSYAALLQEAGPLSDRSDAARLWTRTPIKHVIVIIGENRTFDHIFATYKPKKGETVDNLLSKGIVNEDGSPGPNYWLAEQYSAFDGHEEGYQVSPGGSRFIILCRRLLLAGLKRLYLAPSQPRKPLKTA
jgi:phospholipase C